MPTLIEVRDDRSEKVHYDCPDYPIYIRRGLLSSYPNYTAPKHWHDDIELIAVLAGEMNYNVNGERIRLKSGEGIFINSGQIHFGFSNHCSECDFLCILLHPMLLCATASYEKDFVLPVLQNRAARFVFLDSSSPWKKKIFEMIRFLYDDCKDTKAMPLKVQSAFAAIWGLLYENLPMDNAADCKSGDLTVIKNMIRFIQKNYTRKITLTDIAAAGATGQSKCCKLFSTYFKQSPILYLTQYRLDKSIDLLRTTDMTMTEISLSVGFGSASYYAETFRKWIGKSPSEFKADSDFRCLCKQH